ncbi:MAG TPA: glycosyltransferase, partial [Solirubrobacteraceae bacterium]|nr:glycosyltransferase [Solirubrobacteraceae bacterium]
VDIESFRPRDRAQAAEALRSLGEELMDAATSAGQAPSCAEPVSSFARDDGAAGRALARLEPTRDRLVVFVGKLIVSKGLDLLVAAWPLVAQRVPEARLVVVGFGAYRPALERMLGALSDGDLPALRALGEEGRAAEGGPPAPLNHLLAFLDALEADPEGLGAYRRAAAGVGDRVVLTGRLDHDDLARLLPACEVQVVPSTFPEAFGMVAAEAAACGVLPVCADHSGLAEVAGTLAQAVPPEAADWLTVPIGPDTVTALADRLVAWLQAPPGLREATARALAATARERYSWEGVARGVLAATRGDLDALPPVPGT